MEENKKSFEKCEKGPGQHNISVLDQYKQADTKLAAMLLSEEIKNAAEKIIVLDDDPTGVQTVHDVSVFTEWTEAAVRQGFAENNRVFYILTNSRGLIAADTKNVHRQIGHTVSKVSKDTGIPFMLISRSDSTLRGHYPLETETLRMAMEQESFAVDGEILCPFFKEGGRYTFENEHYVRYGDILTPACDTEFAKDATFGFSTSNLPAYIEEKTEGTCKASDVTCISLTDIREMDFAKMEAQLEAVHDFGKVCVNAVCESDLVIFCVALYRVMKKGKRFLFRSAASLVKIMGGIENRPLLTREEMVKKDSTNGGIVVVGSHTAKTTAQLKQLLQLENVVPIEFNSDLVEDGEDAFNEEIRRCVKKETEIISAGSTAVCFTRRKLLKHSEDTKEVALQRSIRISDGVQRLVGDLEIEPAFIVAKGGITSSDIAIRALKVKKAVVMGQICPGVAVWKTGEESRFADIPYVIFPGNVGSETTLCEALQELLGQTD